MAARVLPSFSSGGQVTGETGRLLGFVSARAAVWELDVEASGRHHLQVDVVAEVRFWAAHDAGTGVEGAAVAAGVGRSTAYRWLDRRFRELRAAGVTIQQVQRILRLADETAARAESQRQAAVLSGRRAALAANAEALRSSRVFAERAAGSVPSEAKRRRAERVDAYWQLMRSGETNTNASRLLGMS